MLSNVDDIICERIISISSALYECIIFESRHYAAKKPLLIKTTHSCFFEQALPFGFPFIHNRIQANQKCITTNHISLALSSHWVHF